MQLPADVTIVWTVVWGPAVDSIDWLPAEEVAAVAFVAAGPDKDDEPMVGSGVVGVGFSVVLTGIESRTEGDVGPTLAMLSCDEQATMGTINSATSPAFRQLCLGADTVVIS